MVMLLDWQMLVNPTFSMVSEDDSLILSLDLLNLSVLVH